jgi:hypothetical protein
MAHIRRLFDSRISGILQGRDVGPSGVANMRALRERGYAPRDQADNNGRHPEAHDPTRL